MVADYYGRFYTTEQLRSLANQQRQGVTLLDISNAAETIGMHTVGAKLSYSRLLDDIPLPGIVHYKGNHFVVVYEATQKGVIIGDPDLDRVMTIPVKDFLLNWTKGESWHDEGIILLLEPTAVFFTNELEPAEEHQAMSEVKSSLLANKPLLWLLGTSLIIGLLLTATVPFLLKLAVDEGIKHHNTGLLKLILGIWLLLFICKSAMDYVKRFTQFHLGSRVHIQLVTTFMMKAMRLPLKYFETKMTEDVLQTMFDSRKVLRFFTRQGVSMFFGGSLMLVFSIILLVFNRQIFGVFVLFSILQGGVIWLYLKRQNRLNYQMHEFTGKYYSSLTDLVRGIKDIKLNNAEKSRRWKWEKLEATRHRLDKENTKLSGFFLQIPYYLAELRDIIIIFIASMAVANLQMTAGVLIAIVFILLQLNNPLKMIIDFWLGWSEIKLSFERMNDVYSLSTQRSDLKINVLPEKASIIGQSLSFRYESAHSPRVLRHLDFTIPYGRTTAIIGPGGSGKTTLLNILLNILHPDEGLLKLGDIKLSDINNSTWLSACGVVPQDGHIFSDTIGNNIALGEEVIDTEQLVEAARIANILPFIEKLPDGFSTIVGEGGNGLSKGQQQGILIARAIYKKPQYLFLDEATNDLDSAGERIVLQNILSAFEGKTIVLIANRMDLPVKIDNIIPLSTPRSDSRPSNLLEGRRGGKSVVDNHF